jgi:hypothetical protein
MASKMNHRRYAIDVSKSWHVAWCATVLGVSEDALLDGISRVGNDTDAIEAFLSIRRVREQRH